MARDPFAPVAPPIVPHWVWIIAGTLGVLLLAMGTTALVAISRRNAAPPVIVRVPPTPLPAPAAPPVSADRTATASAAPASAPDKDTSTDRDDHRHRAGHHKAHATRAEADARGPAAPAAPPSPPKKKIDMSQKEIDKLLGL